MKIKGSSVGRPEAAGIEARVFEVDRSINMPLLRRLLFFITITTLHPAQLGSTADFTVELVRRHSSLSPSSNYYSAKHAITSLLRRHEGDYQIKLSFGTPPVQALANVDSGSDLLWTQCTPCKLCFRQSTPLFIPGNSSSYRRLSCRSPYCNSLHYHACARPKNKCLYGYGYGDGSLTYGFLSTETITLYSIDGSRAATLPNTVFGCGRRNTGLFSSSGTVGIGRGPLSLVSQLGPRIDYKFAYCLLPATANSSSKLTLGGGAIKPINGIVSTPLMPDETLYSVTLTGITVGAKTVPAVVNRNVGNIIVDSGTAFTRLENRLHARVAALVTEYVGRKPSPMPKEIPSLCFKAAGLRLPDMVFHFRGGADVRLKPANTFSVGDGLACMTIWAANSSIFGSWAQANFQVGYDLKNKVVSFAPSDCTKW